MCYPFSALVLRPMNGSDRPEIVTSDETDSHSHLITWRNLEEKTVDHFVRIEYKPKENHRYDDIEAYQMIVDEATVPSWWSDVRDYAVSFMKTRVERMIVRDNRTILIGGRWILAGDARIKTVVNAKIVVMYNSSRIDVMYASSQIGEMRESSRVGVMRESSQVGEMWESSQVGEMRESSQVGVMRESSQVGEMWDSSRVGMMWESSQVGVMRESSRVGVMRESSQVGEMWESSQVGVMRESSQVGVMNDSSRVINDERKQNANHST